MAETIDELVEEVRQHRAGQGRATLGMVYRTMLTASPYREKS